MLCNRISWEGRGLTGDFGRSVDEEVGVGVEVEEASGLQQRHVLPQSLPALHPTRQQLAHAHTQAPPVPAQPASHKVPVHLHFPDVGRGKRRTRGGDVGVWADDGDAVGGVHLGLGLEVVDLGAGEVREAGPGGLEDWVEEVPVGGLHVLVVVAREPGHRLHRLLPPPAHLHHPAPARLPHERPSVVIKDPCIISITHPEEGQEKEGSEQEMGELAAVGRRAVRTL